MADDRRGEQDVRGPWATVFAVAAGIGAIGSATSTFLSLPRVFTVGILALALLGLAWTIWRSASPRSASRSARTFTPSPLMRRRGALGLAVAVVAASGVALAMPASRGWLLDTDSNADDNVDTSVADARTESSADSDPPSVDSDSPSDSDRDRAPLTVAAEQIFDHCLTRWFVPRVPDDIEFSDPADASAVEWPDYPAAEGGFPAAPSDVFATVQGRDEASVTLTGIEVVVHERRRPPEGTLLDDPCGDPGAFRWLAVDLDANPPVVTAEFDESVADPDHPLADEIPPSRLQPIRFPYEISASDAETFLIRSETDTCDCDWSAMLSWQSQGRTGTIEIDDTGRPFRTVASAGAIATCDSRGDSRGVVDCS
jgi:hypothetical protein